MNEESSAAAHLSVAVTTEQLTSEVTGDTTVTSSSPRGSDFYFGCAVIALGVVGLVWFGLSRV